MLNLSLSALFGSSVINKVRDFNWPLLFLIATVSSIGFAMLYSVADGHLDPWAKNQMIRFSMGVALLVFVALVDIRIWMALAYPAYAVALLLLIAVDLFGHIGMGAQRWIKIGGLSVQPSELMKITLVLALARYFHGVKAENVSRLLTLLPALALIGVPFALVVVQPDLGTGMLLALGGSAILFVAGLSWRIIFAVVAMVGAAIPVAWGFLHDYQKKRVFTFLDPSLDPLGAGYHITQSKIAFGSGGVFGKGFMQGTQSHLNFLPEKQTDFIFTMFSEEFGLVGGTTLLMLYLMILAYGLSIALRSRNHFGRLVAFGVLTTFLLYIAINTSMVMGLIPVVGVPLPLVSYGGTAMLTLMFGFGLLMCVHVHRNAEIPRYKGLLI